ncbi:MAG: histidine kinase, partial [Prevotella sp.]
MKNVLYVIVALLYIVSCREKSGTAFPNGNIQENIPAIDDSIATLSPHSRDMIAQGMASATDSVTWYEYYLRLGKYFLLSNTPDSMMTYVDRSIAFAERQEPDPRIYALKAMAYEAKAAYYQRHRIRLNEAISLRSKAYAALMESDDKAFLPEMCANMADTYVQLNDMAQAASWYRRALFLVDSLRLPDIKNMTLYLGLAQIYNNLEDYESAFKYYKECGKFYGRMQPNMKVYYLNNFGNYYYFRAEYQNALAMFTQMNDLLTQYGAEGIDIATCRINLADVYLNIGDLDNARKNLDLAEKFFAEKGIDIGLYYANSIRIGMIARGGSTANVKAILDSESFPEPKEYNLVGIRNRYLREYYKSVSDWKSAYNNLERDLHAKDSIEDARQHMRASEIKQRLKEDTLSLHHAIEMEKKDNALRTTHIVTATMIVIVVLVLLWWIAIARKRKLQIEMDIMQLRLNNARSRISPHFIFNVLNNHISMTDKKESDELMKLVRLIRANLDISRNTFVSLAEEMEFVKYYIDVEKDILGDDFKVNYDLPDDAVIAQIQIPAMFVQILVENAIKHALHGKEGEKLLNIRITTDDRGTDITVSDNGSGFDIRTLNDNRTRTGLDIIRHTIRIINENCRNG